ncbi:MAG: DNA cytosine methyltransferase, partial [Chloroflexi bacterium]|nr:DNA cytosine methyltransferase [Chloroflexota bacterium]
PGLIPYRTAADCIDWVIPCPSIFLSKEDARKIGCKRPLAEATMRRIARGVWKYVIHNPQPFIVPVTHRGDDRVHPLDEPLRTITTAHRGEFSLIAPYFIPRYGERDGQDPRCASAEEPMPTVVPTGNQASLVAAFLAQHNTGMTGHDARKPLSTIVGKGCTQGVVAAHLTRQFGASTGQPVDRPAPTVVAGGGGKTGLVMAHLSHQYGSATNGGQGHPDQPLKTITTGQHHALVKAFLIKYYGTGGQDAAAGAPMPTITAKARMGIVTVGEIDYAIVDIGMRMFTPRELFRCQGFPEDYVLEALHNGKPLTKSAQIRMCGNSVCPQVAEALVRANVPVNEEARAAA